MATNGHMANGTGEGDKSFEAGQFRGYFSAGPSKLPMEVMAKAKKEFLNYNDTKVSVMELSHRSADYMAINDAAVNNVRNLLNVPNNYKVMFMQGGGQGQFAAVPMNLMRPDGQGNADYCVTGTWSDKAVKEAKKYGQVNSVFKLDSFTSVPEESQWNRNANADYLYYCDNETVHGVEFPFIPSNEGAFANVPIVADMSSNFMTRVFDVNRYGAIMAAAQKNVGPSGITFVICREDLMGKAHKYCPTIFDYAQMGKANSILNTPVTYSLYMTNLVMEWMVQNGGVAEMEKQTDKKAKVIYDVVDDSDGFYTTQIPRNSRSRCNAVFRLKGGDESLEAEFLAEAKKAQLLALKGHRSVGGIRASFYSAITLDCVHNLADFMQSFKASH